MKATIVTAWVVAEQQFDGRPFASDLGSKPGMRTVRTGRAAVWLNRGSAEDIDKARAYAARASDEYQIHVFVYPVDELDPLGRARREVLELDSLPECSICRRRHGREIVHACE